jgi:hypothetical protein
MHGPDGLSRWPRQANDESDDEEAEEEDYDDWIDNLYGFMHAINELPMVARAKSLTF